MNTIIFSISCMLDTYNFESKFVWCLYINTPSLSLNVSKTFKTLCLLNRGPVWLLQCSSEIVLMAHDSCLISLFLNIKIILSIQRNIRLKYRPLRARTVYVHSDLPWQKRVTDIFDYSKSMEALHSNLHLSWNNQCIYQLLHLSW